ncbi:MAG: hypothetical protein U5K36_03320 [Roseovarius sp.]|nr:hypothetical protein [Roseovarius sp.]
MAQIADTLQATGQMQAASEVLEEMVALAPERPRLLQRLISVVSKDLGKAEQTRALLATHAERFPGRADFRQRVERLLSSGAGGG